MVGGAQAHLKSNLIPARDAWRVQTKPCEHQDRGTGAVILTRHRARPAFECLVSCRGMGQQWPAPGTGAPTAAVLQTQHVAQVLLEEATISPTKVPPALLGGRGFTFYSSLKASVSFQTWSPLELAILASGFVLP